MNRVKNIIVSIVTPYQVRFIPSRSIHNNIIMANEMIHNMNKLRGNKCLSL